MSRITPPVDELHMLSFVLAVSSGPISEIGYSGHYDLL